MFNCHKCYKPISHDTIRGAWLCACTVWITDEEWERQRRPAPLRVVPRDE